MLPLTAGPVLALQLVICWHGYSQRKDLDRGG